MSDEEKLRALVQRAVENGLKGPIPYANLDSSTKYTFIRSEGLVEVLTVAKANGQRWLFGIFNHDFARALFGEAQLEGLALIIGEQDPFTGSSRTPDTHYWQYHLQQAVIADNPIDYMYRAVFGGSDA